MPNNECEKKEMKELDLNFFYRERLRREYHMQTCDITKLQLIKKIKAHDNNSKNLYYLS